MKTVVPIGLRALRARPAVAVCAAALLYSTPVSARQVVDGPAGSRTCAKACHRDILDRKHMHGPARTDCQACHVQGDPEKHTFFLVASRDDLCKKCHVLPHDKVEHAPAREGRCMECHDPHGSAFPRILRADPAKDLCTRCHQKNFGGAAFVHGPVAVGACIVCHRPHSSPHPNLLATDPSTLCLACHAEVRPEKASGAHLHAALDQGCTKCHDPHASEHKYQLHQPAPGLCLGCHQEWYDQQVGATKVVHGAITAQGGCTGCHESHSSPLPSLQRGTQPGICLSCHDKALKAPNGAPLANMAALLAANPDHHGPIRQGLCTACHGPHSGDHFRLLAEDYPPQFYAPFSTDTFKLCFKCHIQDLVLKPSGSGLTQFRDGERNLHWLHVNRDKGRTCRACHEVHASTRPFHIRDAVPFGDTGWMLEINFARTSEGGSCSPGCHKTRGYSRAGLMPAINSKGATR